MGWRSGVVRPLVRAAAGWPSLAWSGAGGAGIPPGGDLGGPARRPDRAGHRLNLAPAAEHGRGRPGRGAGRPLTGRTATQAVQASRDWSGVMTALSRPEVGSR